MPAVCPQNSSWRFAVADAQRRKVHDTRRVSTKIRDLRETQPYQHVTRIWQLLVYRGHTRRDLR